jgi:exodeoxyribonuclease-5
MLGMTREKLQNDLLKRFPFEPTGDQKEVIRHLAAFHYSQTTNPLYILKGYAGTGKTTIVGTYVKEIFNLKQKFVLMAPTGRAAKVLSQYTGFKAYTIHRFIYSIRTDTSGKTRIMLNNNKFANTIFIVDEASMIGDTTNGPDHFSQRSLLDDLLAFVYSQKGNKLIMIGDTAQLPPVGLNISPALDLNYLKSIFSVTAYSFEMKEVMRQSLNSGILLSATILRNKIEKNDLTTPLLTQDYFKNDVKAINDAMELQELFQQYFYGDNFRNSIVICRSNKRANLFNEQIRNRILQRETELEAGDLLMVVKNNYFWLSKDSKAGFIANGDIIEINRVLGIYENHGFRFAETEIKMIDYPDEKSFVVMLLLDTLYSEKANLDHHETNKLFETLKQEYAFLNTKAKILEAIKSDHHYNALQVKFAYAMTCHKTQGGQWPNVFIDQGYLTDDMINKEYLRWLYTAFTRATDRLFLMGFENKIIEYKDKDL